MLSTRKEVATGLLTTPTIVIVSFPAGLAIRLFATVAGLWWTQHCTRRTRSGVALKRTRMRAGRLRFGTCLSTRVWRQKVAGLAWTGLFAAPTMIGVGSFGEVRVAARAAPDWVA